MQPDMLYVGHCLGKRCAVVHSKQQAARDRQACSTLLCVGMGMLLLSGMFLSSGCDTLPGTQAPLHDTCPRGVPPNTQAAHLALWAQHGVVPVGIHPLALLCLQGFWGWGAADSSRSKGQGQL
jgi:hypothetical protein